MVNCMLTHKKYVLPCDLVVTHHHVAAWFNSFLTVGCSNLANPTNGQFSHTGGATFGQTATYSCNTGYNLVGDSTRTCQATGVWSGSASICQSERLSHKPH